MTLARVYEFGLREPLVNHQLVLDQMRGAHRYRNTLTEIERERRATVQRVMAAHVDVAPIAAEVEAFRVERERLREQINATKGAARSNATAATVGARHAVKEVSGKLKEARDRLKLAKQAILVDTDLQAALVAAETHARERTKAARASCGVYWGHYILAEQDADAARKSITPPKFHPWTGEGRVSVQLQGGIALEEAWGTDTQLQTLPVPLTAHDPSTSRGDRRRLNRTTLRMRVQSEGVKPVWAEWPLVLHRALPEGCRIKVATVHRRKRDCRRWDWRLTIQVELPETWTRGRCGEGAVALNLGYCQSYPHLNGAVRSGYLVDELGIEREIVVAHSTIDRIEKAESIRSIRDKNLDVMRPLLWAWLRSMGAKGVVGDGTSPTGTTKEQLGAPRVEIYMAPTLTSQEPLGALRSRDASGSRAETDEGRLPQWLVERIDHIYMWKSPARFFALARAWRAQRFDGDEEGYQILETWRYRDEHLQRYEAGLVRGAQLDRREKYRILAAELASKYRTLVVGSTDLRDLQRSPRPEEVRTEIAVVKRNQRHAAGSILRGVLANAFKRCGGTVVTIDDDGATAACHACGTIDKWDRIAHRSHTCSGCKATWDQDVNYDKNLLARYWREQATPVAAAPRKESRSERLRRGRTKPVEEVSGPASTMSTATAAALT